MELPSELSVPFTIPDGFDGLYGLVIDEISEEAMRGHVPVRDAIRQPVGLVHGGVYAAIAESLASLGTMLVVGPGGQTAQGLSNHTSFMRPITDGSIGALALRRHRGRTTWVWEVELRDDDARLCALSRVTIAVR